MSMGVMGISQEALLDGLDYGRVGTCLSDACNSKIALFI
jgi:peroxiredoxin family protein